MPQTHLYKLALFFFLAPICGVVVWQRSAYVAELRTLPVDQLSGEVVMLYSPNCGGCRTMLGEVDTLSNDGYRIAKINIDEQPEAATRYAVRSVPTFIFFREGKEQFRESTMMSQKRLADFCRGLPDPDALLFW